MTEKGNREEKHEKRRKRILDAYAEVGTIAGTRRKTGHSRGLIRRVLRGQDRRKPPTPKSPRPSKLDPYRPMLERLIVQDDLTALLAFEELRGLGFDGGYSIVKLAARALRTSSARRPTTVVEHRPGAEGQMDWSPYWVLFAGVRVHVQAFSLVLPFSRWIFLRFALDQQFETLVRLHDEAFSLMGAVPVAMSYDNMTTVGRHIGPNKVQISPRFQTYAAEHDFEIVLTRPGRPNDHASVERHFHYVENNCLKRRRSRFEDLDDLNRHAANWCETVANVRTHGTTRQRPVDRFEIERTFMKPLPGDRAEAWHTLSRKVQSDHCVAVDTNRYSVSPRHVGKPATVKLYSDRLEVLVDGEVQAVHPRSEQRHGRHVLPEHEEEFKRHTPSRKLLEQAFVRLGPDADAFYQGLKAQRGQGAGHHMKRLLNLADRHGSAAVVAAMKHAAGFGAYNAESVVRVLTGRQTGHVATPAGKVPMPPERVRQWLEGLDVEAPDLGGYDDKIDNMGGESDADD